MIRLDATTKSLEVLLAGAPASTQPVVTASYSDKTSTTYNGGTKETTLTGATAVTAVAAPAASTIRDIDNVSIINLDTAPVTVTVRINDNGSYYTLTKATLSSGDTLQYTHGTGWNSLDSNGALKQKTVAAASAGVAGISAGTNLATSGTVVFGSSAGNVSFGMDTNGYVTASAPAGGGGGGIGAAAGTQTATSGTINFVNSNGISFGMSNSSQITASHNALTSQSNQAYSAANGSATFQTLSFANSNGVSFSSGTQGLFATVATNYLTTARASNDAVGLNTAQSNVTWTVNSSGISLDARGYAGTGSTFNGANVSGSMTHNSNGLQLSLSANPQTVQPVAYSAANGSAAFSTLTFANSNGVSFSSGTQGLYATVATNYLTTARASTDAVGLNTAQSNVTWTVNSSGISLDGRGYAGTNSTFNGTNISGSMTLNSVGLRLDLSVAPGGGGGDGYNAAQFTNSTANTTMPLVWAGNSNGSGNLTLGLTGSTVTGSFSNPTQTVQPVAYSAANGSALFSTLTFANSNGVSFSSGTQGLFATVATNYLTTARASTDAIGLNTAQSNVTWTVNSSGLSLDARGYAGTGTTFGGTNVSATLGLNSLGLQMSLSAPTPGGGGAINVSAGTTSGNLQTIQFNDQNGVSFGLNGSTVTASVDQAIESISLLGNVSGNSTVAPAAGGLLYISGGPNVVISGTGNTLVVSASGGGGARGSASYFEPIATNATLTQSFIANVLNLQPVDLPFDVYVGQINFAMYFGTTMGNHSTSASFSSASVGQRGLSLTARIKAAVYSQGTGTNNTRYELVMSNTNSFGLSNTVGLIALATIFPTAGQTLSYNTIGSNGVYGATSVTQTISSSFVSSTGLATSAMSMSAFTKFTGSKLFGVGFGSTLTQGQYMLALAITNSVSTSGTTANVTGFNSGIRYATMINGSSLRPWGNTDTGAGYIQGFGLYSTTSAGFPANIALSEIKGVAGGTGATTGFQYFNFSVNRT